MHFANSNCIFFHKLGKPESHYLTAMYSKLNIPGNHLKPEQRNTCAFKHLGLNLHSDRNHDDQSTCTQTQKHQHSPTNY